MFYVTIGGCHTRCYGSDLGIDVTGDIHKKDGQLEYQAMGRYLVLYGMRVA